MPSPLSHTIVSLSLYPAVKSGNRKNNVILLFFIIIVSLLPDFDIIPGIFGEKIAEFHRIHTHSIFAMVFFSLILLIILFTVKIKNKTRMFFFFVAIYSLHLLLDLFILNTNPTNEIGLPLLYPISDMKFISPVQIFRFKIFYEGEIYGGLFSFKNLVYLLEETVYSLFIAAFLYKFTTLLTKKRN